MRQMQQNMIERKFLYHLLLHLPKKCQPCPQNTDLLPLRTVHLVHKSFFQKQAIHFLIVQCYRGNPFSITTLRFPSVADLRKRTPTHKCHRWSRGALYLEIESKVTTLFSKIKRKYLRNSKSFVAVLQKDKLHQVETSNVFQER